jgi:hypothetical protein
MIGVFVGFSRMFLLGILIFKGLTVQVFISHSALTLCRSYLKPYCMGRKTGFFSEGI